MITQKEYELLKNYRAKGYRWIVRDGDDECLYVYTSKPIKLGLSWGSILGCSKWSVNDNSLSFIKWEDEEPTKINDLINEYEAHQIIISEKVKVTVPQFVADWIEEVKALKRSFKLEHLFDTTVMPDDVYDWLDERYGDTDILAKAWLDGFVVEKEQLYTVDLNFNQALGKRNGVIKFYDPNEKLWVVERKLTQAEIESVNPILMQIAKEVE